MATASKVPGEWCILAGENDTCRLLIDAPVHRTLSKPRRIGRDRTEHAQPHAVDEAE